MAFTDEQESTRDDAVKAIEDYFEDVKAANSSSDLYSTIELLMAECKNQLGKIDNEIRRENLKFLNYTQLYQITY